MLKINNKYNLKAKTALMAIATLSPLGAAALPTINTVVANADTTAVPVPNRLQTSTNDNNLNDTTSFNYQLIVRNQRDDSIVNQDTIHFTVNNSSDAKAAKSYKITDDKGIFNNPSYTPGADGVIDLNKALASSGGSLSSFHNHGTKQNNALNDFIFGKADKDGNTAYMLPGTQADGKNNVQNATETKTDDGTSIFTFYVVPSTLNLHKGPNTKYNGGNTIVSLEGNDTKATNNKDNSANNNSSVTTNDSKSKTSTANSAAAAKVNNDNKNANKTTKNDNDADVQQIIDYVAKHGLAMDKSSKLLENVPTDASAFSKSVNIKSLDGKHQVNVHYNPDTHEFYATEDGNAKQVLNKAQLLALFGLKAKDSNNSTNVNGSGTNSLGNATPSSYGTGSGSAGSLAQTAAQKDNVSVAGLIGMATAGLAMSMTGGTLSIKKRG